MATGMQFGFQFSNAGASAARRKDPDRPLRMLLVGDFSGRGERSDASVKALGDRSPVRVDVDNFEAVLKRFAPRLALPTTPDKAPGSVLDMAFEELDDFHPDRLYARVPVFQALRHTRSQLLNPATFAAAAAALMGSEAAPSSPRASPSAANDAAEVADDLLGRLLGRAGSAAAAPPAAAADPFQAMIRSIVEPHIVADNMPHQAQYLASVDAATGEQMRAVLHHPAFQSLESAWRGVQWLVANLQLGEGLSLHLLDATKDELLADVMAHQDNLAGSGLYRVLVERGVRTPGTEPWSLLVGLYGFGVSADDIGLLAALGALAAEAGGPLLAAAASCIAGCASFAETPDARNWQPLKGDEAAYWQALRTSASAPWIGLVAPRVRLRLPYGKATDKVERFSFEEFAALPPHEACLWGNGALAAALLIGQAFNESGWEMRPGDVQDIGDLPSCIVVRDGDKEQQACAEAYLSEMAGEALLERGLMPLLSYKNRNAVRLMRFQSIASPPAGLAGLWT